MPAPSRPNFVRRLLSFSRQLSSRPSRRGRMCKKTVTTKDGRLVSVGGHGVDVAEAARACAAPVIGQNSTRAGAAEFWAMSGAATKLPPKKLLQRHAGPSQRAAGQLLWRCAPCGLRKRAKTQLDLRRLRRDSSQRAGVRGLAGANSGCPRSLISKFEWRKIGVRLLRCQYCVLADFGDKCWRTS